MKIGGWRMVGNGRSYADSAPVSTVSEMALQLIGHGGSTALVAGKTVAG
jgi:hypothetical protein